MRHEEKTFNHEYYYSDRPVIVSSSESSINTVSLVRCGDTCTTTRYARIHQDYHTLRRYNHGSGRHRDAGSPSFALHCTCNHGRGG